MNVQRHNTIIIGAGLTGLSLGLALKSQGKDALILEKSRGLGGRVATRRIDALGFDHGAAFLQGGEYFKDFLKQSAQGQYFIKGGMNLIAKSLAASLNVMTNQKVTLLTPEENGWRLETEEGQIFFSQNIILTAPLPQACLLLEANSIPVPEKLRSLEYKKALIYLAILESSPAEMVSFEFDQHQIYFMHERSLHPNGIVMHLSEPFSQRFFEESDELILTNIRQILQNSPLGNLTIKTDELKKWRYSQPCRIHSESFFTAAPGLFITGDGFSGVPHSTNNLVQVLGSLA